jgi:membrane-bound ClpP family serine protease
LTVASIILIAALCLYLVVGVAVVVMLARRDPSFCPSDVEGGLVLVVIWPVELLLWFLLRQHQDPLSLAADDGRAVAQEKLAQLVGAAGTSVGDLRPCGRVEVSGQRHAARAAEGFVAAGQAVIVVGHDSHGLVVRERT